MPNRVLSRMKMPLSTIETLCNHYAPIGNPDRITSSHALDILADIWATRPEAKDSAVNALALLALKYDPIRANYWNHRKLQLQKAVVA
jgi:protein farnesyltransferase/geranylgeranyltransferase type-1 subunit alpha